MLEHIKILGSKQGYLAKDVPETKYHLRKLSHIVEVGEYTYGDPDVIHWDALTKLYIGNYCSIAKGVTFLLGGGHNTKRVTTYPFESFPDIWNYCPKDKTHPISNGDIVVGSDVWIGQEVIILSGVTVGHGAVIGTRSVVTKDVEPYSIVAGNPARVIKKRFDETIVNKLLIEAWWNWPIEKIKSNMDYLHGEIG